jgi:hypothetical protein
VIRQYQDRLVQLQSSHTPSNSPSSHILCNPTGVDPFTYTLPSIPPLVPPPKNVFDMQESRNHNAGTRHDSPIPISLTNTYSLTLRYPTGVDLPTYTPHSQYIHPLSRVPTGVDLPIYTSFSQYIPPYSPRPNPDLPTYASTIHTTLFSCPKRVDLPTYTPSPFTIHTASFSCPKRVDLPTYTPPHSQYIQPLSRVPTGVDLPTYILPFLFSIPTNTVRGRGVRGVVCYLWAMLSLAGGQCQMRFVRAVSTDGVSYL